MNKLKFVNITGYSYTGSQSVVDYIKEFLNVKSIDTEIQLLATNGGLDELNYKFSLSNNYISGLSIQRFLNCCEILSKFGVYSEPFDSEEMWNGYFIERTNQFVKEITDGFIKLNMDFNLIEKRELIGKNRFKKFFYRKIRKIFKEEDILYTVKSYNVFKEKLKEYIEDLLNYLYDGNLLVLKHFIPSYMISKRDLYVEEIGRYIIVDRDPRDIFILLKRRNVDEFIPRDVFKFIEWYRNFRQNKVIEDKDVLKIQFEDMIYDYENITKKINHFLNLEEKQHTEKFKYFNPEVSIKNTLLFKLYPEYINEIEIIEKELKEYCYNFPEIEIKRDNKNEFF